MITFQEMRVKSEHSDCMFYRGHKPRWICAVVRRDMDKIKVVHDAEGQTLTVWLDDPAKEAVCEKTTDRGYGFMLVVSSPFVAKELKPLSWKIR